MAVVFRAVLEEVPRGSGDRMRRGGDCLEMRRTEVRLIQTVLTKAGADAA